MRSLLAGLTRPPRRGVGTLLNRTSSVVGPSDDVSSVPNLASSQYDDWLGEFRASLGTSLPDVDGVRLDTQDPRDLLGTGEISGVFHESTVGPDSFFELSARRRTPPTENSYSGGMVNPDWKGQGLE